MTTATLVKAGNGEALPEQSVTLVQLFERLATDPNASVEKIERLMALLERGEAKQAEAAFNGAMSQAQQAMRAVAPDAENPQTRSRYASYDALDRALRPIYTRHGFALSFNTADAPTPETVRVCCDVMHLGGHAKPYHVDMPADGKGAKGGDVMTKTHATGSAISYGMRYLLKMIFNVAIGEHDDDGNAASATPRAATSPESGPPGFTDWWSDMQSCADEGWPKLSAAWNRSPEPFRRHLGATNGVGWRTLKAKAQQVQP